MDSSIASKLPVKRKSPETGSDPQPPPFKFHRIWTEPDEIRFLQGLLDGSSENLFFPRDLNIFYTKFSNTMSQPYTKSQLSEKLRRLKKKFRVISSRLAKGLDMSLLSPHDRALYDLSRQLWHPDFVQTSPFNADKSKKSNLVGVKVSFLPTIPTVSNPVSGHNPTHDGFSLSNGEFGDKVFLLPTIPSVPSLVPGQDPNQGPTRDGVDDESNDGDEFGVKASFLHTCPAVLGPHQGLAHDVVSMNDENNDGNGGFLPTIHSVFGPGQERNKVLIGDGVLVNDEDKDGNGEFGVKESFLPAIRSNSGQVHDWLPVNNEYNDGKLSEVNVELDRGDMGEKLAGSNCLDGPIQVGVGFGGVAEMAAKVVMNVFDECLSDFKDGVFGERSSGDDFWKEVNFEERWKEQRVAELDVLARRLRLVLEHSLQT